MFCSICACFLFYDDHDHDHVNNDDDGIIILPPRTIQKFIQEEVYKTTLLKLNQEPVFLSTQPPRP